MRLNAWGPNMWLGNGVCVSFLGLPQQSTTHQDLYNRRYFLSSGGSKSEIKVLAWLISFEASLLVLQMAVFFLCIYIIITLKILSILRQFYDTL